ncbi:MAG TPA: hypothetical protein VGJ04_11555 [Pirellulales bacterium]|jgi:CheY-like chemotaxis protein
MLIAFLTTDLVFPSRVAGVAQQLGATMATAASAEVLLEELCAATSPAAIVLLDLNSSAVDPAAIVPQLKALDHPPRVIVAFGPHVHEQKLAAAQGAGCDVVLTRGQFDAQMQSLLKQLLQPSDST